MDTKFKCPNYLSKSTTPPPERFRGWRRHPLTIYRGFRHYYFRLIHSAYRTNRTTPLHFFYALLIEFYFLNRRRQKKLESAVKFRLLQ